MTDSKPANTPIEYGIKLEKQLESNDPKDRNLPYRELVGALSYLGVSTRQDVSRAVSLLGQFNNCYGNAH